jgi:predicted nucleic acid-binding protein
VSLIKTYLDSGVLITLFRAADKLAIKAEAILDDEKREFISSLFVKLEVLSKAIYHKKQDEVEFYEAFFGSCKIWATDLESIVQLAQNLASKYGLSALDALQIASAISVNADEFITTEKITKPLHRVQEIKVISIAE